MRKGSDLNKTSCRTKDFSNTPCPKDATVFLCHLLQRQCRGVSRQWWSSAPCCLQVPGEGVRTAHGHLTSWHNNSIVAMCCFLLVSKYARVALINKHPTFKWFHFNFEKNEWSWTALKYVFVFAKCKKELEKAGQEQTDPTEPYQGFL